MKERSKFTLTEDHLKLLSHVNIEWDDTCYDGAAGMDLKRPYHTKYDLAINICFLVGWITYDQLLKQKATKRLQQKAMALHRDMQYVLQIVLIGRTFELGKYELVGSMNHCHWTKVKEKEKKKKKTVLQKEPEEFVNFDTANYVDTKVKVAQRR